jgi:hypothetical protein
MTLTLRAFAFLVSCTLLLAPLTGHAQADAESLERLSVLVAKALPMGALMQSQLDGDPTWPLLGKADKVAPAKLQCLRQRLSAEGYLDTRRAEVKAFAAKHPERVEGSIRVLEQGASEMFAASFQLGVDQSRTGRKADYSALSERYSPLQMSAFIEMVGDEKHRALREVIGIDDAIQPERSGADNEARGRSKGKLFGVKVMLAAMDHCNIPMAAIQ